ncbi:MAG: helix-turn-helix domain-containing protein [Thermoleophilia bacterium]|nr:helix-turn-helix domain-containing protein [Thermoleophilia bacterium]
MLEDTAAATTGIPELDLALGGLYWGDNVVWELEGSGEVEPFFRAAAARADAYHTAAYVTLTRSPDEVLAAFPGLEVLDARPGSPLAGADALIREIRARCSTLERDLLLFDPLETIARQWGVDRAQQLFTQGCPMLLELGAIAYWSLAAGSYPLALRREIEEVTQCVLAVADGRVRIAKSEGRPFGVQGTVFRYELEGGAVSLAPAPAAARLGGALRSIRLQRHLSQSELARLAGVSPSAVSQAERGQRGLSLETLLDLTARLGITLDELLRGEVAPGYRLARRHDPRGRPANGKPVALLDDPQTGLRAYLVRLAPKATSELGFAHKGVELIAVASGLVQVVLATGRPVLRHGEALLAERSGISAIRNLSDGDATVFWILRDEPVRPEAAPV